MYARQTYALGHDGASRLSNAAALVVGMGGVGAEAGALAIHSCSSQHAEPPHRGFAAKNLVLSGFRLVAVHDDDATQQADLAAQARAAAARRARGCS
jgi:molybdopterin/thiamine biosynthesis adenylyltransferase